MFNHYQRQKKAVDVSLEDMFPNATTTKVEQRAKTPGFIMRQLIAFFACCAVAGALLSIYPVMILSYGVQAAEPVVDFWKSLPEDLPSDISIGERNVMYDANGDVFATVWTEDRIPLASLDQISDHAKQALIATEDKRFYEHKGIDINGTIRSAISGSGGGSGITQQLVKNLRFFNMAGKNKEEATEATIERKLRELKYALGYEKTHSKDEILLQYFNTVAFGGPNTYSIEKASQYFFGKPAKDLSLAESTVLVGSVQSPAVYNLAGGDQTKDAYKQRQGVVLSRMVAEGHITQEEADQAYDEELNLVFKSTSNGNCSSSKYPFYCDYVLDYLRSSPKLGETQEERDAVLAKGGLQIYTYLDPEVTQIAQDRLDRDYGDTNRVVVPVSIVQPGTGGVLTVAQNRKYGDDESAGETTYNFPLNRAGTGSTYKMITLAAATNHGYNESNLAFSSMCPWAKAGFDYPNNGFKNSISCERQGGHLDFKHATAWSSNTWFVELESRIGVSALKDFSRSVGLSAPDSITDRSASYTLGTTENSTVDMAAAFATFSNEGVYCPPTPVVDYKYADGSAPVVADTYDPATTSCQRVMSPHGASIVLQAMRANISGEVPGAFGLKDNIPGFDTAAKSGTNELMNSAWAHVSKNYSLYANLYDPKQMVDGVDYVVYRGYVTRWWEHVSGHTGSGILQGILSARGDYSPLDFNNTDDSKPAVPVDKRDFFTVPNVVGMTPAEALATLDSLGIPAHVAKEHKPSPENYPAGVVVEQSLEAGTQLPVGTKKEIIIYTSKVDGE